MLLFSKHSGWDAGCVASLGRLSADEADGYMCPPVTLDAALQLSCVPTGGSIASAVAAYSLAAAGSAAQPSMAGAAGGEHDRAAWLGRVPGAAARNSKACSGVLEGITLQALDTLQLQAAASRQGAGLGGLMYSVEWQAADSMGRGNYLSLSLAATSPVLEHNPSPASCDPGALAHGVAMAASELVGLLKEHRTALPGNTLTLRTLGALPAGQQPAAAGAGQQLGAAGAAAALGILKNLPFEMPFMQGHAVDFEPAASSLTGGAARGGRRHGRGHAVLPTRPSPGFNPDLYGAAVRGSVLHRPLMQYSGPPAERSGAGRLGTGGQGLVEVQPHAAYAVTGGLGGLGLLSAQWMLHSGTQHATLLSRSGRAAVAGNSVDGALAAVLRSGAAVTVVMCDASSEADAAALQQGMNRGSTRFAGVIHAAGLQVRPPPPNNRNNKNNAYIKGYKYHRIDKRDR
jgi:hypothetical protein